MSAVKAAFLWSGWWLNIYSSQIGSCCTLGYTKSVERERVTGNRCWCMSVVNRLWCTWLFGGREYCIGKHVPRQFCFPIEFATAEVKERRSSVCEFGLRNCTFDVQSNHLRSSIHLIHLQQIWTDQTNLRFTWQFNLDSQFVLQMLLVHG